MRRSVPPERVQQAEQQRAAMAAAARVQGVLIPPGTATVILSFDGPVDVPALHNALVRMIEDGDHYGLSVDATEPPTSPLATGGVIDKPGVTIAGQDDGCAIQIPHFDGPTTAEAFEEATRDFHEHALATQVRTAERLAPAFTSAARTTAILEEAHEDGQQMADAVVSGLAATGPFAATAMGPARIYGTGDGSVAVETPLEFLRAHGPATAAQTAAALGITPQKAARELTALVRDGQAEKSGKTYAATEISAASAEARRRPLARPPQS